MNPDLWNTITAISAAVQSIVIIIALLFAIAQLREAARARATEAMRQVFQSLANPEARRDRKLVYQSAGANFEGMPDDQLQRLWNVAVSFNNVGLLLNRRYLPAEVVYDIYGDGAVRCWNVLQPLIQQERKRRGEMNGSAYYLKYFEEFAKNSEEYLKKHYPGHRRLTYGSPNSGADKESKKHFG